MEYFVFGVTLLVIVLFVVGIAAFRVWREDRRLRAELRPRGRTVDEVIF